jgi:hypothetical protein
VGAKQARALATFFGGAFLALSAFGQISPGPLSEAHAEIDGSSHCLDCHTKGEGVAPGKCLECHKILAERVASGAGLHAGADYADCRLCHVEHSGREFELVWWGQEGIEAFDHAATGETLAGKHRELECRQCHRAEHVVAASTLVAAGKDLGRTFLGLSPDCASCHADEHRGQFAPAACKSCHDVEAFVPTRGFDHDATAFTLTGRHRDIDCAKCHAEEPAGADETFTRFKPVPHQLCSDCHRDPHEGSLGSDCASCHGTESWFSTPGFDHAKTRFPLTGRHRRTACADCHRRPSGALQFADIPFAACTDCHADPHENRLGPDCASCHQTAGWDDVPGDRFDHGRTSFPLAGAHVAVECAKCHRAGEPLRIAGAERCATCHADEHLGQFAERDDGGACDSCHTVERFVPALFTEESHALSRFALTGLHRGIACIDCHQETSYRRRSDGQVVETAKFRFESLACVECHVDPHEGTADRWLAETGCAACHSDAGWTVPVFDHSGTSFPLEAGHREVACGKCHDAPERTEERRLLVLEGVSTDCAACHDEPHGGQFDGRPAGCGACHTAARWADLVFEHDRDSSFSLAGAHARAQCGACHTAEPAPPGSVAEPIVRYTPLPTTCEGCHAPAGG